MTEDDAVAAALRIAVVKSAAQRSLQTQDLEERGSDPG